MLAKRKGVAARRGLKEAWMQSRDLTNRNRISGSPGRTSDQRLAKSTSIKGLGCRSGGCAVKEVRLTSGGLCRVPATGLGKPQGDPIAAQKSAEGIVGRAVGEAIEALQCRKAETTDRPNRKRRSKARTDGRASRTRDS